jgi:hypothetical protein
VLFVSPTDFGLPCPPTPPCQIVGALLPLLSPHARTLLFHTRLDTGVLDVGRRADFGAEPTFRFPALLNSRTEHHDTTRELVRARQWSVCQRNREAPAKIPSCALKGSSRACLPLLCLIPVCDIPSHHLCAAPETLQTTRDTRIRQRQSHPSCCCCHNVKLRLLRLCGAGSFLCASALLTSCYNIRWLHTTTAFGEKNLSFFRRCAWKGG